MTHHPGSDRPLYRQPRDVRVDAIRPLAEAAEELAA